MTIAVTDEGSSFIELVRKMREVQREYFRIKDRVLLAQAKRLEREVDEQLEAWEMADAWKKARETNPELFLDRKEDYDGKTVQAG